MKLTRSFVVLIAIASLSAAQSVTMRIGSIDFYGTSGIDVRSVHDALPIHTGDTITEAKLKEVKQNITSAVVRVTGAPPTDISAVCCEADGDLMIYIGLPGSNSKLITHVPSPSGSECLPQSAIDLYNNTMNAVIEAVRANDAAEDDSKGYALSHYPALRENQFALRKYAVAHSNLLESAVWGCRDARNREAAAHLLGYTNQSRKQIETLIRASDDSDASVRNNAIRALWVLASSRKASNPIPASSFVPLLNSGMWEDRNKAGMLLTALAAGSNPTLLADLRSQAFDSLAEMARWHSRGHADAYRELLGKIAGFDDDRIRKLIAAGQVDDLIFAAEAHRGGY